MSSIPSPSTKRLAQLLRELRRLRPSVDRLANAIDSIELFFGTSPRFFCPAAQAAVFAPVDDGPVASDSVDAQTRKVPQGE